MATDQEQEQGPAAQGLAVYAEAYHDRLCPACGRQTLTVVVVRIHPHDRDVDAGGWAHCSGCDATPHPTMEVPGER
ncbi:hypothetical protein [Embleya sp. NPDC001921]